MKPDCENLARRRAGARSLGLYVVLAMVVFSGVGLTPARSETPAEAILVKVSGVAGLDGHSHFLVTFAPNAP